MRLTLRTLLAYMDDTLDPVHAREIGQKIGESPTANKLMGRVRDVMRRRRLTAPQLTGPGAGLDVNTVAEYLDNTTAPERVPDIEKVYLESDMHLAEVGASHQILTLVLGEPADIETESRRRMYRLVPSEAVGSSAAAALAEPAQDLRAPQATAGTFAETMPGYLRQPPMWKRALPVGVVVLFLALVGVVWILSGGFTEDRVAQTTAQDNGQVEGQDALVSPVEPSEPADEEAASMDDSSAPEPTVAPEQADSEGDVAAGESEPAEPKATSPTPAVTASDVAEPAVQVPALPLPVPESQDVPAQAAVRRQMGQYVSTSDLLLNFDEGDNTWSRLPNRALIYSGDSLLVPPLYRARFDLEPEGTLEAAGRTRFEMLPPTADETLAVRIAFGRLVFRDLAVGTTVLVEVDQESWRFTVRSAESVLAFEAESQMPLGFESTLQRRGDFKLFVSQGQVSWRGGAGEGEVEDSSTLLLQSSDAQSGTGSTLVPLGDPPSWFEGAPLGILDQKAAHRLQDEAFVPFGRAITLPLIEATQDRRREVRKLAAGCLGAMGRMSALFEALNDEDADVRRESILWLRHWLAQGGEHVAAVREALDAFRSGQGGKNLDRLLWGYTDRDLQDGGGEELVNYLENDDLPIREVAMFNLEEITGRTLNFKADSTPVQRDRSVRQWRRFLEDGKLVPRQRRRI